MNQILSMNEDNSGFGSNYNNYNNSNNGGGKGPMDLKKVKIIFAVLLMAFGLALLIGGGIGIAGSLSKGDGVTEKLPKFSTQQADNNLTVMISSDETITSVEYAWNNGEIKEIDINDTNTITKVIIVPTGDNILKLKATDAAGKVNEYSNSFHGEVIEDTTPPTIELVLTGAKLNIIAKTTTETKLSYLTYKWSNDNKEVKTDATGAQTNIETKTDIPKGKNTLTVIAVNEKGIEAKQTKEFDGVKKPTVAVSRDGDYIVVKLAHEVAVKSAKITFNNKPMVLTDDRFGKPTVEFKLKMVNGENKVKIEVTSSDNTTEVYEGVATK